MASNLWVVLNDLAKMQVKTTPGMALKSILELACEKYQLNAGDYGLKCVHFALVSLTRI